MTPASDDVASDPGATQDNHLIAIQTELGQDALLLTALDGIEAMSRSFVYTIEVLTKLPDERVRGLLGKPVTLWLANDDEAARRPLHGHVRQLRRLELNTRGYRRWRAEVSPWLWFLTKSVDCRIYQHLSIPEILRSVFTDHELAHFQFRLLEQYPKLEFCVQYRESAFAFVSRLMEHAGIAYWFEHQADRHVLVIADSNQMAPFTQPRQASLSVRSEVGDIHDLVQDFAIRTGASALNDYDFEVPTKNLRTHEASILGTHPLSRFEVYDYPGHFTAADDGKRLTRLRMEEEEARHVQVSGLATCVAFHPGKRFELAPDREIGDKPALYLLTELQHRARDSRYFTDAGEPPTYSNRFVCIPAETVFRPERLTSRPVVQGPQTATVVGPAGENIHTDQYGRVRVLFHWDRRGERNERASCWLRVSQQSAGSHLGGIAIPHVGQEVIVDFLEGDPDRPIITGRVHNGAHMPPLDLPRDKDKTIIRDHGDNKLIMHGAPGKQWMSMVSPRALNFVAARSAAKPLSASVDFQHNTAPYFEDGLDSDAFLELQGIYAELTGQLSPPEPTRFSYGKVKTTSGTDDTSLGDYSAGPADINTLSEGRINSLSLGTSNVWVGKDLNQEVVGDTDTVSHGSVSNTFKSQVTDNFDTFHEENSTWHNEFTALHSEFVGAHTEVTGAHVEVTVFHLECVDGIHIEQHANDHWSFGVANECHTKAQNIKITADETEATAKTTKAIDDEIAIYMQKTHIAEQVTELTAQMHAITTMKLSVSATTVQFLGASFTVVAASISFG